MLVLTPKMFAEQAKKLGPNFIKAARKGALAGAYRAIPIIHKAVGAAPPANPRGIGVGGRTKEPLSTAACFVTPILPGTAARQ